MEFDHVDRKHRGYYQDAGSTIRLPHDRAIATFAAAFLKKGLVREVRVNIGGIAEEHVPDWSAKNLERFATIAIPSPLQRRIIISTYMSFWLRVSSIVGPDWDRKVHVETAFSTTGSPIGTFRGSVLFTLDSE